MEVGVFYAMLPVSSIIPVSSLVVSHFVRRLILWELGSFDLNSEQDLQAG